MSKKSKQVTINTLNQPLESSEPLDDSNIQAPKVQQQPPVQKVKRVLTDAQKAVLEEGRKKGRETIANKNAQINAEKEAMKNRLDDLERQLKEQKEKEFEDKLVKKALSIKKKQIKRDKVLDQISDDDTNIEEIKEIKKRQTIKKPTPAPAPAPSPQQIRNNTPFKITFV